ncbi:MAG: 50S ribosomal protein L18 [Candidatus Sumerlaeia bacterium]|nr:50S ribosomal protein L18 [Candidatus Sumerlaeia bacterium]
MMKNYWKHRKDKWGRHQRRRWRIRKKVSGVAECPRLLIRKTARHLYAQLINDDVKGGSSTFFYISTRVKGVVETKNLANVENAKKLGAEMGKRILEAKIESVVFDRGGYRYHGIVKEFADAVRAAGVVF